MTFPETMKTLKITYQLLLILSFLTIGASASPQPCLVCSVEQGRIHAEECKLHTDYQGREYYFCQPGCQEKFKQSPEEFVAGFEALQKKSVPSSADKAGVGDALPNFSFPLQPIGSVSKADLKGKVVVFNLWASWCAPCKRELPAFIQLQNKLRDEGLVILGISFDQEESKHREAQEELHFNFPSFRSANPDVTSFLNQLEPVEAIPVTVIVDRDGKIVKRFDEEIDSATLEKAVLDYLEQKAESSSTMPEEQSEESERQTALEESGGAAVPS